jgi:hypothetical protein
MVHELLVRIAACNAELVGSKTFPPEALVVYFVFHTMAYNRESFAILADPFTPTPVFDVTGELIAWLSPAVMEAVRRPRLDPPTAINPLTPTKFENQLE